MAIDIYVAYRTPKAGDTKVNGVQGMVVAIDNLVDTTVALVKARCVTIARAQGHNVFDGYFDTLVLTTLFNVASECFVFGDIITVAVS